MKRLILLFAVLFGVPAYSQTNINAHGRRMLVGPGNAEDTETRYSTFIIPADQQQGIGLDVSGDNSASFGGVTGSALPWFMRIARDPFLICAVKPVPPATQPSYTSVTNPLGAYGEAGGGTPLYTDREYRFGLYAGGRSASRAGVFRIRAYQKSQFTGTAMNQTPVETKTFSIPFPMDGNWDAFLAAGSRQVETFRGMRVSVEMVSGSQELQWHAVENPYVLTISCTNPDNYFVIDYKGWVTQDWPLAATSSPVTANKQEFRPCFSVDFTTRPTWRTTYLDMPHFTGKAVPSEYLGLSPEELAATGSFTPPSIPASHNTATAIDDTPELRRHPKLDKLVADLGNDPVAIANYVHNEIKLVDPLGFSEDGQTDPSGIWAGGMNRNAFNTYMEGGGNPWEQCALLVYMMRKAGYPAVYVEPKGDSEFLLDTQLEKLLRMRIKGATDSTGAQRMPTEVPVHYPWVAVQVPDAANPPAKKWVHLFPWIKDTSVVEGGNLYEKFPETCKTGTQWVTKYLKADPTVMGSLTTAHQTNAEGNFLIEAERYQDSTPGGETLHNTGEGIDRWMLMNKTGSAGYYGDSWMQANNGGADFTSATKSPKLEYVFDVPAAGTYYVWLRANTGISDRRCFVTVDTQSYQTLELASASGWTWGNKNLSNQAVKFTVSTAGRHTLRVAIAHAKFALDRVLLTTSSTLVPTNEGGTLSIASSIGQNTPSNHFLSFAREKLAASGVSLDDIGMKYLDRKSNRTSIDEFPRPYRLNAAAHTIYGKLSDRPNTFDTVRVSVAKDALAGSNYSNPNVRIDSGEWLSMDVQNRPFYINVRKRDKGEFRLMMTLAPFRDDATGTGNFYTADKAQAQWTYANFDYIPNNDRDGSPMYNNPYYDMEVTHLRQRRASADSLVGISVTNAGSGYTTAPAVTIAPPPNLATNPTYRTALALATVSAGKVTGIQLVDPGYGYDGASPAVTLTGGSGSGATAEVMASSRYLKPDGTHQHPLGVSTSTKVTNKPNISEGDLGALCFTFGSVSQRTVDHLAEDYWKLEERMKKTPSEANSVEFREAVQGRSAYLVGMDYYRRVGEFRDRSADLHKTRIASMYAAGLSKLQAFRSSYWYGQSGYEVWYQDVLSISGQFYHNKPSVDMFFLAATSTASDAVHSDAGMPGEVNNRDFWPVLISEVSAQEHQIINDYYREDAAISTVRLLQRAQVNPERVSPATGVIRMTKQNYVAEGDKSYTIGPVTKKLKEWNTKIWTLIDDVLKVDAGKFAEVYITPGNIHSSSLSYNGVGAMILGKSEWSALIGGNAGLYNGGFGSDFGVARFEASYLPFNTLTLGAAGYTLQFGGGASTTASLVSAAASLWQIPSTYSELSAGTASTTSYQNFAWSQQASSYGLSGSLASDYKTYESRGATGSTSFFGALGNSIGSIGSAIGTMVSQIGGWVSDPVDVVTGDFYVDAVDLTLPGPMPLTLRRNYSSLSVSDGEFGHGWKSSILPFIGVGDNGLLFAAEADGSVIAYKQTVGDANLYVPTTADNPTLKNLNGEEAGSSSNPMNNRIVKSVEGSFTIYTLSGTNGGVRRYKVRQFPIGTGADLITRERPYIESWKDAQGNELTFTYYETATEPTYGQLAKITATNGNALGFNYDVSGHITEAWTQDGRRVVYDYDLQGDLKKVTLPDGSEHRYDYSDEATLVGGETVRTSQHLLVRETKPEGRMLENDYDSQRRVVKQRAIVGTTSLPVQNAEFVYANTQNADKTWSGTTTVKDAYGRPTVFTYVDSLITSEDDPETPAETREWYAAGETTGGAYPRSLKQVTDRRGVVKFYKYDIRGNVVEKSLGTDANPADIDGDGVASPGEKSVTSWTYNLRNLPETQTDPSGVVTKWFYDNATYPYLASRTEKWSGSTLISKTVRQFTQTSGGGKSAKGLIEWEKTAQGTTDQAIVEWLYDERGFATRKTSRTGTTDPDVVVALTHNLRGELVEEKQLAAGGAPERNWTHVYDAMGRRTVSTRSSAGVQAIEQTQYTPNGEVEWTDGPRTGVNDRVLNRYDKNGRLIENIKWLSGPMVSGAGVADNIGDDAVATTFYSYDLFNNLTEIRTPRRHSIAVDYDQIGRTKRIDYYSGYKGLGGTIKATRQFLYEPGGEVSQETDALGGVTKLFYNARGQLRRRENPDGSVEQWRFYADGRPFRETLRNGSYKELAYDDANRKVTETLKAADGSVLKTAVSIRDRRGNLVSETKGGYTTLTTYDALDRVKSVTGPPATGETARRIDSYSYPDPHGRLTIVTNALGDTTTTKRDALDRVLSIERKDFSGTLASVVSHEYSADHNKVTTTEGTGVDAIVTERWSDTMGNPAIEKRSDGTNMQVGYQMGELPVIRKDFADKKSYTYYDWQGAPTQEIRTGNVVINYENDPAGNMLERRMPNGMTEVAQYDSAGRVTLTKLIQGSATTRQMTYQYYPAGHTWAGMLKSTTDARNIVTTRTYDAHLRLATAVSDGPDPEDDLSRTFTYDELDHLITVTETGINGTTTVYRPANDNGGILSETVSVDGMPQSSVSQRFDGAGRRSSRTVADFTQTFAYRADDLLQSTTVGGKVFEVSYNTAGLHMGGGGPFRSLVHLRDSLGRITLRRINAGGVQALDETIPAFNGSPGWSAVDKINRISIDRTGAADEFREFVYDASDRLIVETYPEKAASAQSDVILHAYDNQPVNTTGGVGSLSIRYRQNAGRELYIKASNIPSGSDFYRNTLNQFGGMARDVPLTGLAFGAQSVKLSIDGRAVSPVDHPGWQDATGAWNATANLSGGTYTLTATAVHPSGLEAASATSTFTVNPRTELVTTVYDEVGNVHTKTWSGGVVQTFTWDARNRLVKVVQTGAKPSTWTARYDGFDRRIRTTFTPQGGQAATVRQVYDPEVEFLEIGQGASLGSGAVGWSWKAYGVDLSGTFGGLQGLGGLEAVRDSTGIWRGIVSDWWGNTAGWIERPGDPVTWNGTLFGAWGNVAGYNTAVQDAKSPLHQLLGYRGLTIDPPGFIQMGLRPYDMMAGTWLSCDPLGHDGSLSLYDYCDNDPVNLADPDGRFGKAVGTYAGLGASWVGKQAVIGLTGYSGNTSGMTAGQIWGSYRSSSAGMLHAQQWDSAFNWVPVVNVAKWTVEGISGRNFITGADLTVGQQIGAVFNVGASVLPVTMGAWASRATAIGTGSTFSNPNVMKGGFQAASKPWGAPTTSVGTMNTGGTTTYSHSFLAKESPKLHGNSLKATGPHDVYVVREAKTGQILHFGETGRTAEVRGAEWQRKLMKEHGIESYTERLATVEGKAAAKALETRYIRTYEKVYGFKPGYTDSTGKFIQIQKTRH